MFCFYVHVSTFKTKNDISACFVPFTDADKMVNNVTIKYNDSVFLFKTSKKREMHIFL